MGSRPRLWRQYIRKHWVVAIIIALVVVMVLIFLGYWFKSDWTGFNEHIGPNVQQYQPAKTLWDWLQLLGVLAIPVVVGLGAVWFTIQQGKVSDAENKNNQREAALQAYIDKMSELLLVHHLRESLEEKEVCKIARVQTLTVLRRLDGERRGNVLLFLQESGLIDKGKHIVDLSGADLKDAALWDADLKEVKLSGVDLRYANLLGANLSGADLSQANLTYTKLAGADLKEAKLKEAELSSAYLGGVNFSSADLNHAFLSKASLNGATLTGANLKHAYLDEADLTGATLTGADLSFADLTGATLSFATLSGALVTTEQLDKAKSLQGATMTDGSKHP